MKLAIVTGTSQGLGFEIANFLLLNDLKVYSLGRSENAYLESHPQYQHQFLELENTAGHLPVIEAKLLATDWTGIETVYFVHNAAILLAKTMISVFEKLKLPLQMIFISSPGAAGPIVGSNVYCIAKVGQDMLVKGIHSEASYYSTPIKCASFSPARIDTQMQAKIRDYPQSVLPTVERYRKFYADNQLRSPELVAQTLCEHLIFKEMESGRLYQIDVFLAAP
jgi:NADP-dependent 3-hydroxy acid dehydrogenase YdfG